MRDARGAVRPGSPRGAFLAHLIAASVLLLVAAPLSAQVLEGIVLRPDSTPVEGVRVELHRITQASGSVADSALTDSAGRFRFRLDTGADESAVFLPAARHEGILYWGTPIHASPVEGEPAVQRVAVFDTAVVSGPLTDQVVAMRHIVLTVMGGGFQIDEVLDLPGQGDRTLVAVEDGEALWRAPLARDAHGAVPADGGVGPGDLGFSDGDVVFTGVLPPGGVRVAISYIIPSSRFELEMRHATRRLDVLVVEAPGLEVTADGLSEAAVGSDVGVSVRRFTSSDLVPGARVSIQGTIGEAGGSGAWMWFALALVFAVGALVSARLGRRP